MAPRGDATVAGGGFEQKKPLPVVGEAATQQPEQAVREAVPQPVGRREATEVAGVKPDRSQHAALERRQDLFAQSDKPWQHGKLEASEGAAAGDPVQQAAAERLVVSRAQLPSRQAAVTGPTQQAPYATQAKEGAQQETGGEALRQAQPATLEAQPAAAIGKMQQAAAPAPLAAAAAVVPGPDRKQEAKVGQQPAKGADSTRVDQEVAGGESFVAEKPAADLLTRKQPAAQPQGLGVAVDDGAVEAGAGEAKVPQEKLVGLEEGAGEVAGRRAQHIEQTEQPQAAAKGARGEASLHRDVLSQIKEGTVVHDGKGNGTMSIRLNPGELGELKIQVHMEDNRVKVAVQADNRMVKDLLMSNLDSLKEALSGKNFAMEGFDVSTGGGSFHGQQAEQREQLRQQAMPRPVRLAGYEDQEVRQSRYSAPSGSGLLDVRL